MVVRAPYELNREAKDVEDRRLFHWQGTLNGGT